MHNQSTDRINRIDRLLTRTSHLLLIFALCLILYVHFTMYTQVRSVMDSRAEPSNLEIDEDYTALDRLREASFAALAVNDYLVEDPNTVDPVAGIASANRLPPGITASAAPNAFASKFGSILVRYTTDPLVVEAICYSKSPLDGPAVMVRLPKDCDLCSGAMVFVATTSGRVDPPPPFASIEDCLKAGWLGYPMECTHTLLDESE